jgi:chorismate mutase
MKCRGIRGAICARANETDAILVATHRLLEHIVADNNLQPDDIASIIFTTTPDLDAAYPARAAREMGWTLVPLLCVQEMNVVAALPRCIRVLIHWNTDRAPDKIRHVYLGEARALRPDLAKDEPTEEEGS